MQELYMCIDTNIHVDIDIETSIDMCVQLLQIGIDACICIYTHIHTCSQLEIQTHA